MGKEWGSEPLGSFYTTGKVRNRREWRGVKDTFMITPAGYISWGFLRNSS